MNSSTAAATAASVLLSSGGFQGVRSHAITRSSELLSCAKTALRILQQQSQKGLVQVSDEILALNPNDIHLYINKNSNKSQDLYSLQAYEGEEETTTLNPAFDLVHESQTLLALLDSHLEKLNALVKRRGQTNDPTHEIHSLMSDFNKYTKELMDIVQNTLLRAAAKPFSPTRIQSSQQRMKHYQNIAQTIQGHVETRMRLFKEIMTIRGNAIEEMSQRRRRLLDGTITTTQTSNTITSTTLTTSTEIDYNNTSNRHSLAHSSPLFTMTDLVPKISTGHVPTSSSSSSSHTPFHHHGKSDTTTNHHHHHNNTQETNNNNTTVNPTNTYAGYGGYNYGNISYAYGGGDLSTTGIRRRPPTTINGSVQNVPSSMYTNNIYNNKPTHTTGMNSQQQQQQQQQLLDEEEDKKRSRDSTTFMKSQLQLRKESRQTQSRLETAREAEKSLAELTTMFTKMSTLIQSQGEVLIKVEDDVEAAMIQVNAGAEEITKLYIITKGNRGLIIKVFSILILLIILMRFYR